jgi:hypothetical protein
MADKKAEELLDRWQACRTRRQTLDTVWDQLAQMYRPQREGFTSQVSQGSSRMTQVYDGEQIEAVDELANSIESMLTPASEKWIEIGTENRIEAFDDDAARWCSEATDVLVDRMYDPRAGLQVAGPQVFGDLVTFGAAPLRVGERSDFSSFLFRTSHLRDVHWYADEAGLPQTVYARMCLRGDQVQEKLDSGAWRHGVSRETAKLLEDDKNGTVKVDFLEVTTPRRDRNYGSAHVLDMPFAVYLVEIDARHLVDESGEQEQPWVIPTWQVLDNGNDIWSPGRRGLPDVLQLQAMAKTILRAGQRVVDPPIMTIGGAFSKLNLSPGFVNFFDPTVVAKLAGIQKLVQPLELAGNLQFGWEMLSTQRKKIADIFLRPVLRLPDKSGMTATEVMRLNQDLVRLTDSPFGRLDTGYVQPLVERCFQTLLRQSILVRFDPMRSPFRPIPPTLSGARVRFKFLNPITRARKVAETAQLATFFESMLPLIQARPEVLDNVDLDAVVRDYTSVTLAPKYLVPKEQVQANRDQRKQQQLAQLQSEVLKNVGQGAGAAAPLLMPPANQQAQAA